MAKHLRAALHFKPHHQIERFVEQLRERMRRVKRQGREHWQNLRAIIFLDPRAIRVVQIGNLNEPETVLGERRERAVSASNRIAGRPSCARGG